MGDSTAAVLVNENDVWGPEADFECSAEDVEDAEARGRMDLHSFKLAVKFYESARKNNSVSAKNAEIELKKLRPLILKSIKKERIFNENRGTEIDQKLEKEAKIYLSKCRDMTKQERYEYDELQRIQEEIGNLKMKFYRTGMGIVQKVDTSQRRLAGIVLRLELNPIPDWVKEKTEGRIYTLDKISKVYFNTFIKKYNENKEESIEGICRHWCQPIESNIRKPNGEELDTGKYFCWRQLKLVKPTHKNEPTIKRKKVSAPPLAPIDEHALLRVVRRIQLEMGKIQLRQQMEANSKKVRLLEISRDSCRNEFIALRQHAEEFEIANVCIDL